MKQLLLFCLLFSSINLTAQSIDQKLIDHQNAYHLEKIYISHNQPYYASGDTLYGKVFLVNGRSHQYFGGTPLVYLDWMTEKGLLLASYILKIENGTANIAIPIERDYGEGRFLLRAYTQYQKNFDEGYIFQKEIKIIGEKPLEKGAKKGDQANYSVQFFPEGGHLVEGLTATVAFQAMNGKGEPIDITGTILNEKNEEVAILKSLNEGIGVVNFQPQKGGKYQAKVSWNGLMKFVELPIALKAGYLLKANNRKAETVTLRLMSNTAKGLKDCTLIGHLRGQPFLNQVFKEGATTKLVLDKKEIPSGVLHFTLFDGENRPVCERLIFNRNPVEQVNIDIVLPKNNYGVKELVVGEISGAMQGVVPDGDFTLSVFNQAIFGERTTGSNIENYLLLQSDLQGRINNINQYFKTNDAKSRTLLDYVMLTHGWRRFNWQDVLANKTMPIVFPTEESLSFAGKIMKDNNRDIPVKGDVFLSILDKNNFTSTNLTTDDDGLFYFKGFDLPDSTEILIQGNVYNGKKKRKLQKGEAKRVGNKNVKFELLSLNTLTFNDGITLKGLPYNKQQQITFAKEVNRIRKIDTIYHPEWTIDLSTVTVKAKRLEEKKKRDLKTREMFKDRGLFYSDASQKIYTEDLTAGGAIYNSVYEVIRNQIGGVQIIQTEDEGKQVLLRAQSSFNIPTYAAIELNGAIVTALTAESIDPTTIALIDVKRGLSETAIYGDVGNGGVITIITKDPGTNNREIRTPGILTINHPGYHKARTFYAPDYTIAGTDKRKPDYRTTLYWNPDGTLGKTPTPFKFYTGDKYDKFLIFVEGITTEGIPFVGQELFEVGSPIILNDE